MSTYNVEIISIFLYEEIRQNDIERMILPLHSAFIDLNIWGYVFGAMKKAKKLLAVLYKWNYIFRYDTVR